MTQRLLAPAQAVCDPPVLCVQVGQAKGDPGAGLRVGCAGTSRAQESARGTVTPCVALPQGALMQLCRAQHNFTMTPVT
jgi:hypothetical protein